MTATTTRTNSRSVAVEDLPKAIKIGENRIGTFAHGARANNFNLWAFEGLDSGTFINTTAGVKRVCWKCAGSGFLAEYAGIFDGVCMACNGGGTTSVFAPNMEGARRKAYTAIKRQEREAAKRAAQAAADAKARAAHFAEWIDINQAFVVTLAQFIKTHQLAKTIDTNGYKRAAHGDDVTLIEMAEDIMSRNVLTESQLAYANTLLERVAARKTAGEATRYAADVDAKITVTGKVTRTIELEPVDVGYGNVSYRRMILIEGTGEQAGCIFKWIGTSNLAFELEEEAQVKLAATVKKHDIYNDTKQTVITRCRVTK